MQLSVQSCGSGSDHWKSRARRPLLSKIVKRDIGDYALILTQDPSKPLRFLYFKLLIGKNGIENLKKIILKIQTISVRFDDVPFEDMSIEMKKIGNNLNTICKELNILKKKLQSYHGDHIAIIKIINKYPFADTVLLLALRVIAFSKQCKIENALYCGSMLTLKQIQKILEQFSSEKLSINSSINRFIYFEDLTEIDISYFKEEGLNIENEASNYEQLSDPCFMPFQQHIMIEKLYSLL